MTSRLPFVATVILKGCFLRGSLYSSSSGTSGAYPLRRSGALRPPNPPRFV
jgi:hypothetical protein